MKHEIYSKALAGKVYLLPDVQKISPLEKLQEIWFQIKQNITVDLTIVLRKPTLSKRSFSGNRTSELELHLFAESEAEARKFTAIIQIIGTMIDNLRFGTSTTKRDVYYKDVELFQKSQAYSNDIIASISYSLGFSLEHDLKIFATQKGLVFSNFPLVSNGKHHMLKEPILIPRNYDFEVSQNPQCILVIEKDAIFKSFCEHIMDSDIRLLVITGKGFPDSLTKEFVKTLSNRYADVPVLGFMDSDIYGISICKSYKYNTDYSELVCPNFEFGGAFLLEYKAGSLAITTSDWKRMASFVNKLRQLSPKSRTEAAEIEKWHRETTRGMLLFRKSELNVIETSSNNYIMKKVLSRLGM